MAQPDTISNLDAWWKADSLNLANGAAVATWIDSSGNGLDATQANATRQPSFATAVVNGRPAVRFNGAEEDRLDSAASSSYSETTIFAVFRPVATLATNQNLRAVNGTGGLQFFFRSDRLKLAKSNIAEFGASNVVITSSRFQIGTALFSDAADQVVYYHDGVNVGTASTTLSMNAGLGTYIGNTATGEALNGDIAELIVYSRVLSTSERATVHSYLQDKYAIAVTDYVPPESGAFLPFFE